MGYKTLERFSKYIDDDEINKVDSTVTDYNKSAMEKIYNSTKNSLNALLSGEKKSVNFPNYKMNNLMINNTELTDGENIVFSIGYGHFSTVKSDIENLHSFGMNNFQMETGPRKVICIPEWEIASSGNADCYYDVVGESDSNSVLMIENKTKSGQNAYFRISQTVQLEPSTRYYYGFDAKGTNLSENALQISAEGLKNVDITSEWDSKAYSFVSGSNAASIKVSITVKAPCDAIYLDNVFSL